MSEQEKKASPATVGEALLLAQRTAQAVAKDSKNEHHKYKYAAAEDIIQEAREAFLAAGLVVYTSNFEVDEHGMTTTTVRVAHPSDLGGGFCVHYSLKAVPGPGRPDDKAQLSASTQALAYLYRNLLNLPRVDASELQHAVDRRNDHKPAPAPVPKPEESGQVAKDWEAILDSYTAKVAGAVSLDALNAIGLEFSAEKAPKPVRDKFVAIYQARQKAVRSA